jgi:hypothetical protein
VPERTFPDLINSLTKVIAKADGQNVCDLVITTGRKVNGKLLDPDGKALMGARVEGPVGSNLRMGPLTSAAFSVAAVNPRAPKPHFFYHAQKNLAAAVILKGDEPR